MVVRRAWVWFLLLPMFFQIAYYKPETGPLYPFSKAWPVLLAPLVLYGATVLRLPDGPLYLVLSVYALGVTPFLSMLYLPNTLLDAFVATLKAWPLTFYFSVAAALVILRPSERGVARATLLFGAATFAVMAGLWLVTPLSRYGVGSGANLFSWDEGRGYYIRMPMMLAEVALFWVGQRFARERRLWQLGLLAAAVGSMLLIYKARLPIGVSLLILLMAVLSRVPARLRWGLGAAAALPATAVALVAAPLLPDLLARTFDESLFIRLRSVGIAWDWLADDPLKLLLGTGSAASSSATTMADFFGYADFWLTDIGWLGVLLEYGVVGTGLIVAVHLRALATARRVQGDDPFRRALADYVLFEILCSCVYSVMYAPGPVVTAAAVAWWLKARDQAGLRAEGHAGDPLPRPAAPVPAPVPPSPRPA